MNKKLKIGLTILALIISIISTKVYAATGKVNQETIRMRKEASTDSSIVTLISLNEDVEVISEEGEWYKIKYKTYTGYVRKDMLDVEGKADSASSNNTPNNETNSTKNTLAENATTGNSEANNTENAQSENNETTTENKEAENITNETVASTTENENTNTSEESKNTIQIGYTGTITSKLELKLVPSITSSNINTIEENSSITIKDIMNKWSYVEAEGKAGWALTSKIQVAEQKEETKQEEAKQEENKDTTTSTSEERKVEESKETEETKKTEEVTKYVSTETLNMRETADNNAKLVSQIKINTKVTVVETSGTWSKIKVNGKAGYVASKYLSDKKVDITSRSEKIDRGNKNSQKEEITTKTENKTNKNTDTNTTTSSNSSSSGSGIVACAKQYLGCRYVSGGSSPSTGFDCSGFTSYVYKQCGISISRSSGAQASNGTAVSKSNLQPGDLVIFNNRANTSIGHVGIYIGGNTFIHAGNSGTGVITTSLSDSYYSARYVTGRRIIN